MQCEIGRFLLACFPFDWALMTLPLCVGGSVEGRLVCVGPFRFGWFPKES